MYKIVCDLLTIFHANACSWLFVTAFHEWACRWGFCWKKCNSFISISKPVAGNRIHVRMCRSSNPKFEYCQNLTILGKSKIWCVYRLVYVEFRHTFCCSNLSFIAIRYFPCRSKQMCIEWLFLDVCIISNARWDRDLVFGLDLVFSIYRHR